MDVDSMQVLITRRDLDPTLEQLGELTEDPENVSIQSLVAIGIECLSHAFGNFGDKFTENYKLITDEYQSRAIRKAPMLGRREPNHFQSIVDKRRKVLEDIDSIPQTNFLVVNSALLDSDLRIECMQSDDESSLLTQMHLFIEVYKAMRRKGYSHWALCN